MDLDLDRMLAAVREGQWSVDDIDWSPPLAGGDRLSPGEKRECGLALVFTARLERQAARIFALTAEYVDDPRAREIYRWFAVDERRHADAEVRLAARYGITEHDLPRILDWSMRVLEQNFDEPDRGVHELSSASIILFELALDTLLVPSLKDLTDDPLQAQVFRRIDLDESRHLAMDYWLLDQKGANPAALPPPRRPTLRDRFRLYKTLAAILAAFGTTTITMPVLRRSAERGRMERYLSRVAAIPRKAPHALDVPGYRMSLAGQRRVMAVMEWLS
jgi:hypothetical protein